MFICYITTLAGERLLLPQEADGAAKGNVKPVGIRYQHEISLIIVYISLTSTKLSCFLTEHRSFLCTYSQTHTFFLFWKNHILA